MNRRNGRRGKRIDRTRAFRYALLTILIVVIAVAGFTCFTRSSEANASDGDVRGDSVADPKPSRPNTGHRSPFDIADECGRRFCRIT